MGKGREAFPGTVVEVKARLKEIGLGLEMDLQGKGLQRGSDLVW
jgi:hypothetical protein